MKHFIFAANWKMYLSAHEETAFCIKHKHELSKLAESPNTTIALFPSFVSLKTMQDQLQGTRIKLGAQDCSDQTKGPFTGQIAAQSLADVGCYYCIIGHSERKTLKNETQPALVQKVARLREQKICPIICIGETREEYDGKKTAQALTQQITPYFDVLAASSDPFCIAYEPIWAIGTGLVPTPQELETVLNLLATTLEKKFPQKNWRLLYGGSINALTAPNFYGTPKLDGFLIGGASADFQEFKKIVLSMNR